MKKIWMIWLFVLLVFYYSSQITALSAEKADFQKRIISAVVWNDAKYPVEEKIIRRNLAICLKEYTEEVGVIFQFDGKILPYRPKPAGSFLFMSNPNKNYYFFRNLRGEYAEEGYIDILGENEQQQIKKLNQYLTPRPDIELKIFFSDVPTDNIIGIVVSQHNGIIAIYPNSKNKILINRENKLIRDFLPLTDTGSNSLIVTALNHEIGHLFGLEHTQNKLSFMYDSCVLTFGQWTEDIIKAIKKNKWKKWQDINSPINW